MVDYATWVGIVSQLAEDAGLSLDFQTNQEIISTAAKIWNQDKEQIKQMTKVEARNHAELEIEIEL